MNGARVWSGIAALLAAGTVGSCDLGEEALPDPLPDARPELRRAVERTLDAGPSAMSATVRARGERYRLSGRLDPQRGYRFCGRVRRAGGEFPHGHTIWLEERGGSYSTLTTAAGGCAPAALWLDDHPPTLHLAPTGPGAEDHLHAALTALVGLERAAGPSAAFEGCGSTECIRGAVDFGVLDRRPAARDEDGWTLRPLLRRLGSHPVTFGVDADGRVDRIVLAVGGPRRRVTASIRIRDFGLQPRVPRVGTGPIAIE
jgi:hypothetical protein